MDRVEKLRSLIRGLHDGMGEAEAREIFKREFGRISGEELAAAEQQLVDEGMPVEEITRLCDVHASVFEDSIMFIEKPKQGDLPLHEQPGHPAFVFRKENDGLERFLNETYRPAIEELAASGDRSALVSALKGVGKITTRYKRKENLFFPFLEREGVLMPPKVMWAADDEIRETLKETREAAEGSADDQALVALARKLDEDIRGMMVKENNILLPMLSDKLKAQDWVLIAKDSPEIGYIFTGDIEGASPSDANTWLQAQQGDDSNLKVDKAGEIQLGSGYFTAHELEAVLNSLPIDLTFVGADDKVHYFSEGKTRVFPRTRSIIGRDVSNCHPPKSLHVVEKLVQDFKDGVKDSEDFWIQKDGLFILIRYFAVRDSEGRYLGVVETTEEISALRSLDGSKTLLS